MVFKKNKDQLLIGEGQRFLFTKWLGFYSSEVRLWMKKSWSESTSHNRPPWPALNPFSLSFIAKVLTVFPPHTFSFLCFIFSSFYFIFYIQFDLWIVRILTKLWLKFWDGNEESVRGVCCTPSGLWSHTSLRFLTADNQWFSVNYSSCK